MEKKRAQIENIENIGAPKAREVAQLQKWRAVPDSLMQKLEVYKKGYNATVEQAERQRKLAVAMEAKRAEESMDNGPPASVGQGCREVGRAEDAIREQLQLSHGHRREGVVVGAL